MNISKVFSIAIVLLLVQGCKIIQVVPEGGFIQSRTGDNDCSAGQTCVIDIPGVDFGDTFTAVPAPGYHFVRWNKRDDGPYICGGSTGQCALEGLPASVTVKDVDLTLEPIFEVDLLGLLPQETRGVYQVYPQEDGAIGFDVPTAPWGAGPLQIIQRYSAGMDVEAVARRLILAQLSDTPDQFILLAALGSSDVGTLTGGIASSDSGSYQGYPLRSIDDTDLEFATLDNLTLAIAPRAALERALDAYAGTAPTVDAGPLGGSLASLDFTLTGRANSFVYGLPALYGSVVPPGEGSASLSEATVLSSFFAVESGELQGLLNFSVDHAADFKTTLSQKLAGLVAPSVYVLKDGVVSVNLAGLSAADDIRPLLKTLVLDMNAVDYADAVVHGGNVPWMNFEVGGDPAAIFVNFEFDPAEIAAFEAEHLPPGFSMEPFRMLETDTPRYMMVLNIYQSSGGLVEGARAEWSVFVGQPSDPNNPTAPGDPHVGEPRFMVIEAKAATLSADSVNGLTQGEPVTYGLEDGALVAFVGVEEGVAPDITVAHYFSSSIPWPQEPENRVDFDRAFMTANDYVFWGNGVADRILYNHTAHNRPAVRVDPGQFSLQDDSAWAGFLKDEPLHAAVYLNNQEIVISPWWNLEAGYLDVEPVDDTPNPNIPPLSYVDLVTFKNNFYPLTVRGNAEAAIRGQGAALSATMTAGSLPAAYYHFPLSDAAGLLTAVAGPGAYVPAALELFAGEGTGHYLTLAVYERQNDSCGTRAEWVTYVVGADGYADSLMLDAFSADSCLDPVSLLTVATDISHGVGGNLLTTEISSPYIQFDATVNLELADEELVSQNWLEANEWVCALNDICNDYYYDGQLLMVPIKRADTVATQIHTLVTPWDDFIDTDAARAGVRLHSALQVFNPWRNLRSFAADAPAP